MTKSRRLIVWLISFLPMVIALIVLPILPDTIPTHYGLDGKVDDYGNKYISLMFPIFAIVMGVFLLLMMKLVLKDKDKEKGKQGANALFWLIIIISLVFLALTIFQLYTAYTQAESLISGELDFDQLKVLAIFLSIIGIIFGMVLPICKQNWIVGIRTKLTLESKITWDKTHSFAGKMFMIAGIISTLLCLFVFNGLIGLIFYLGISTILLIPILIYSYYIYKHEGPNKDQK